MVVLVACGGSAGRPMPDAGRPDSGGPDCGALTACGSQCVDTSSDPENCGACAHSCQGGACSAGACEPVVLASGEDSPGRLAVSSGYLYWTSYLGGAVKRVPVGGGPVETIASGLTSVSGISATETAVYWLSAAPTDGGVWAAPLDGGSAAVFIDDGVSNSITRVGDRLYWGSLRDTALNSVLLDGGAWASWPTPKVPTDIATDGQFLYWGGRTNSSGVYRTAFDGGEVALVAPGNIVVRVAAVPGALAWVEVTLIPTGTPRYVDAGVFAMPLDGGAAREIAPLGSQIYQTSLGVPGVVAGLAADGQYVFWTDLDGGAVYRARWSGSPEAIATGQDQPVGLTEDSSTIYWSTFGSDGGGTLMKLAK